MSINYKKLIESLDRIETEYLALIKQFEEEKNFSMAYLSNWIIIEKIIKAIAKEKRTLDLKANLELWIKYLEGNEKKPKEITSFNLESFSLPDLKLFDSLGFEYDFTKEILNSSGKYKKTRNSIAHESKIITERVYTEYREKLEESRLEIREFLKSGVEGKEIE